MSYRQRRKTSRLELTICHSSALIYAGELDAAIEKLDEIKDFKNLSFKNLNELAILIDQIADRLIVDDIKKAISFISNNRDVILSYIDTEDSNESVKDRLEGLLFIEKMHTGRSGETFCAGGIAVSESYYRKYSKEKKNGLFEMMAYNRIAERVKRHDFSGFTNDALTEHSQRLAERAKAGEGRSTIIPEAFALVSEAGFRVLGYRHHQMQYVGAAVMLDSKIAEILNGEGKTYTITLVAYVNSLYHSKTLVVDSSKYLTKRNYNWMLGVYELLGVKTDYLCSRKGGSVLLEESEAKIVYTDWDSLAFSVIYDEQAILEKPIRLSDFSAIIDEVDNTLIDNVNTAITISGADKNTSDYVNKCMIAYKVAENVKGNKAYYSTNRYGTVFLTREIRPLIEDAFKVDYENIAHATEINLAEKLVEQALYYTTLVEGKDFFVKGGIIYRENRTNGMLCETSQLAGLYISLANNLPSSRYSSSLSQRPSTYNTTYVYGIFSQMGALCGTSATVCSFKQELKDIYGLDVIAIPPTLPIKRIDSTVGLYIRKEDKNSDIISMIAEKYKTGQPILLIAESIKESVKFSDKLEEMGIEHTVINGLNAEKSPEIFAKAGAFGSVVIATQLANRGIDIKLGGDPQRMTIFDLVENGVDISDIDKIMYRIPTEEIKATKLYQSYIASLERNKALVAANKNAVIEAGGLCVISTSIHEDMRVEQQIRGRAGRQGDVGESYIFMSMDDSFFKTHLRDIKSWLVKTIPNLSEAYILDSSILSRSIESVKRKVHHAIFSRMKNETSMCKRIDESKKKVFDLKYGIIDGSVTLDELSRIWSRNESNINSVKAISEGNANKAALSVLAVKNHNPERFDNIEVQNASNGLFETVRLCIAESQLSEELKKYIFARLTSGLIENHLTEMSEAQEIYNASAVKNTDKILDDMYKKSLQKHLENAIDIWVIACLRDYKKH